MSLLLATGPALAAAPAPPAVPTPRQLEPGEIDASAFRDHLGVLTDGKGHYVAVVTFEAATKEILVGTHLYYGDGQRFHALRSAGGGSSRDSRRFYRSFWAPRARKGGGGRVGGLGDVFTLTCGDRDTDLKALAGAARAEVLATARFFPPLWQRRAHTLARDDEGNYYYVDHAREPAENFDFRLFYGPRGDLKRLPLINIVSDSEGDIFASKRGRLRLVLNRSSGGAQRQWQWINSRKRIDLIEVPVPRNTQLIYRDLGVYDGQRLGTPCDDL